MIDSGPVFLPDGQVFDQPTNIGDGTKDEVSVTLTVPGDQLGWKGALLRGELNKRWSEVTDPTTLTPRRISGQRPLEWEVLFSQDLPQYGVATGWSLFGGWEQTQYRYNFISEVKLHNAYFTAWVEKKLQPQTVVRLELANWAERGIRIATAVYDGPRSTAPLKFYDDRDLTPGRSFLVRVRHTFGA